jgi:hypothetical protein
VRWVAVLVVGCAIVLGWVLIHSLSHKAAGVHGSSAGDQPVSLTRTGCFEDPEQGTTRIEACGYPGTNNVGVERGITLTETTACPTLTGSEHYEDKRLVGNDCGITVAPDASGVVIRNDEVIMTESCPAPRFSLNYGCVGNAIEFARSNSGAGDAVDEAAKNTRIEHVFVHGLDRHGVNTVQTCVDARWNSPYVAEYVKTEHCSGFKLNAGGELNHVYCPSNYEIGGEHYECVTDEGDELNATTLHTPLIIKNSTIFQPPIKASVEGSGLTAAIFQQSLYGPIQETIYEDDLIAGGNFALYFGFEPGRPYTAAGPDTVRYDRFARCVTHGRCPDEAGYFPEIGAYHVAAFNDESKMTWQHNFIDAGLEPCDLGVGVCY